MMRWVDRNSPSQVAVLGGLIVFLGEWGGLTWPHGRLGPPRPLAHIWWHLPVWIMVCRFGLLLPRPLGRYGRLREDPDHKPTRVLLSVTRHVNARFSGWVEWRREASTVTVCLLEAPFEELYELS